MATVEYFEMSAADLALARNNALGQTLNQLIHEGVITSEQGHKFAGEHAFVAVRNTSVIGRIKDLLFSKKDTADSYSFPIVKITE